MKECGTGIEQLLGDLAEAVDAAVELVELGKERWDTERPLRLAGEAVVGRIGDIATKLPEQLLEGTSELPWAQIKGMRIVVDHAYHGIDYERVWRTLRFDVPEMHREVDRWAPERTWTYSGDACRSPPRARCGKRLWTRTVTSTAGT